MELNEDRKEKRIRKDYRNSFGESWQQLKRRFILEHFGMCSCCNKQPNSLELDHIIPLFCGGNHEDDNLQLLCRSCHKEKTAKDVIIINCFKKLGLVEMYFNVYYYNISREKLKLIYHYLFTEHKRVKEEEE